MNGRAYGDRYLVVGYLNGAATGAAHARIMDYVQALFSFFIAPLLGAF